MIVRREISGAELAASAIQRANDLMRQTLPHAQPWGNEDNAPAIHALVTAIFETLLNHLHQLD